MNFASEKKTRFSLLTITIGFSIQKISDDSFFGCVGSFSIGNHTVISHFQKNKAEMLDMSESPVSRVLNLFLIGQKILLEDYQNFPTRRRSPRSSSWPQNCIAKTTRGISGLFKLVKPPLASKTPPTFVHSRPTRGGFTSWFEGGSRWNFGGPPKSASNPPLRLCTIG